MKRILSIFAFMLAMQSGSAFALPFIYTFEGVVDSYHSSYNVLTPDDVGVVVGETRVNYVFSIDFDTLVNESGSWYSMERFHADLISGSIMDPDGSGRGRAMNFNYNSSRADTGSMGSFGNVSISTNELVTDAWRLEDWTVGQTFHFIDQGEIDGVRDVLGLYGSVQLISITPPASVPEPSSALLFLPAFALLLARKKFAHNKK